MGLGTGEGSEVKLYWRRYASFDHCLSSNYVVSCSPKCIAKTLNHCIPFSSLSGISLSQRVWCHRCKKAEPLAVTICISSAQEFRADAAGRLVNHCVACTCWDPEYQSKSKAEKLPSYAGRYIFQAWVQSIVDSHFLDGVKRRTSCMHAQVLR